MYIIFFGIILRVIFAYINSFYGPFPGLEFDAIKFHEVAVLVSEDSSNMDFRTGWLYSTVLGLIYRYTFDTIFFGSLISILGWLISGILIVKIIRMLKISVLCQKLILILYSFWPSALIYTSVTLREPFQLLLFNLAIFTFLKIFLENKFKYKIIFFVSILLLPLLHKMFVIWSVAISIIYLLFLSISVERKNLKYFIIFSAFIATLIYFNFNILESYFYSKLPLNELSIYSIMSTHINNLTTSRASYLTEELFLYSFKDLITYTYQATYNYMLQPTPNNQETFFDLLLFVENIFRIILILFIIINIFNIQHRFYRYYIVFLLLLFIAEITWALGTTNWGTAVRHHVPALGLLLFLSLFNSKQLK